MEDETPHEGIVGADGLSWERINADPNQAVFSEAKVPYSEVFAIGYHDIAMMLVDERRACANLAIEYAQSALEKGK